MIDIRATCLNAAMRTGPGAKQRLALLYRQKHAAEARLRAINSEMLELARVIADEEGLLVRPGLGRILDTVIGRGR